MAVFQQSDAASTGSKKLSPVLIAVIIAVVLLCCCCIATIAILIATGTITSSKIKDLTNQGSYLPLYLTLRTWL
jgi:hypothetical protein